MKLGIPKEITENETRVALVPVSVKKLVKNGLEVLIESSAGINSSFSDKEYTESGAKIIPDAKTLYSSADLIIKIKKPEPNEIDLMREEITLVSMLMPSIDLDTLKNLTAKKISVFSLESIPRITRAQSMDILSSMSTVSGYKAVLIAANSLPKFFPMLMTAAGTVAPAKVFIIGAGVAGLQAIATARRLGAITEAFDTRSVVKEQVESLGARFVELDLQGEQTEGEGGYAKQISKELHDRELELISNHVKKSDVVITTAQVPGKRAPILITELMVKDMKPGSVIIDLAADQGGNCEITELGKSVVKHAVNICGFLNLPATMPNHASQMFSKNMESVISHLVKNNEFNFDLNDEINKGALITHKGVILQESIKHLVSGIH
ncbi:MAG: NAD(P) transhydrogenase subunit alpha [Candidatus Melainabacteria bacterium RIFCSPHIGHO2_02_FULL_34_12]|nr:MAG: NAD(P) transhydrogenase subunit alpha [Candidatus Melainabacteria bacterium RIFCSPHIGHO2_02_FULL_34_12]